MRYEMRLIAMFLVGVSFVAMATDAHAQGQWTILPLNERGVDEGVAQTFRDLLQGELSARSGASFAVVDTECQDVPCARKVGADTGSDVVVMGSLNALGKKIIVSVTVVEVGSGEVASNQKITVDKVEDLDQASVRIAEAIMAGTTTKETAKLGTITANEVAPARRREGQSGLGLRLGGLAPLTDGFADGAPGVVIDFSYWYETNSFAIEPRFGLRFAADSDNGSFFDMPVDVGAYYILTESDFAPFIGGGAGLRFMREERSERVSLGSVISMTNEKISEDEQFGFSTFARAGLLLFRTYTMRLAVSIDYNIAFVKLNGAANPQSLTTGIAVYF
jgi:hypothetical protein